MAARCHTSREAGCKFLLLQALLLLLGGTTRLPGAAAELVPFQQPDTQDGNIQLSLLAAFGRGLNRAAAPELMATLVTSKAPDCTKSSATTLSLAEAAEVAAAAAPAASLCTGRGGPLKAGLYSLLASRVDGANWATWKCYASPLPGTPAAAAAGPAAAPMYSVQAVELKAGFAYTCVATYIKESAAQAAATAAISWPEAVAAASAMSLEDAAVTAAGAVTKGDTEPVQASCVAPAYTQPPAGKPAAPLRVRGKDVLDASTNKPISIRGLNWFGFNVAMGMVDGLWAGGTEAATDFGLIAYQIKMLGYNAVRLPFTFNSLANTQVWDLKRDCADVSPQQLKQRLVDPQSASAANNKILPDNPSPLANNPPTSCNTYLPSRVNRDRLLFVLQAFIAQGMYVVLDYQPMGTEQHPYDLSQFVSSWVSLWRQVACLPNFDRDIANRVFVDVMNEPDSMGIRWEAQGNRPGAEQLYLATADALWKANPGKMLFMFEGTGQNNYGLNWGNGFITDPSIISSRGLSNPNSFFKNLLNRPWAQQAAIISPHVYPPTITGSTWLGTELWKQCTTAFGYLQTQGYCAPFSNRKAACLTFPVLVGETGSAYKTDSDKAWLQDFADYVNAENGAAAYNKAPMVGWMWWAYNENSGDTGGIVTNNWQDLHWEKLRFMISRFGLKPWYMLSSTQSVPRHRRRRPPLNDAPVAAPAPTDMPVPDAPAPDEDGPAEGPAIGEAPTTPIEVAPEEPSTGN